MTSLVTATFHYINGTVSEGETHMHGKQGSWCVALGLETTTYLTILD